MWEEEEAVGVKSKMFVLFVEVDGSLVRDITGHDEKLTLLLGFSKRVRVVGQHLGFEKSFSENLKDGLSGWHIDVEHTLWIT